MTTLRRTFEYTRGQRGRFASVLLLSLLDMGLNAQLSLSFQYIIDKGIGEKNQAAIATAVAALCVSVMVAGLGGVWRDRIYATATSEVLAALRQRVFAHLQTLSAGFYSRTPSGQILSRFGNDAADIERTLLNGVPWGVVPALDAALSTILIFWLDWRLALVALLAYPLAMCGPKLLASRTTGAALDRKRAEADLISGVQENVAAQALVRGFSLENLFMRKFHSFNLHVRDSANRLGFLLLSMERSAVLSTQILQVAVLAIGGWLVFRGSMTLGTFAGFQSLFVTLTLSLSYIAQYLPQVAQARGSIAHIDELLDEPAQVQDAAPPVELHPVSREIAFRDVSFSYDGAQRNLDGVTLAIPYGSSVAFVGPSGSGKSTILSIAMRLYDPLSGEVCVDGHNLRTVTQQSLRSQMGIVFQDNFLLNASIRENIRIANPAATDAQIIDAAKASGMHEFVCALPDAYDTVIAHGRFSGGQRQRLGIARALLRNPRILILDEATSALDAATEGLINETLERASAGRTVLSVTHRLGSAVKADCIYFLDKGRVVEQGKHEELLALNGAYARLWSKQSGFEIDAAAGLARITPERLQSIPMLASLDGALLDELSRCFTTELCSRDQFVFQEGETGGKFYIVVRGTLEVFKSAPGGAQRRVEVLQDGDVFGEQALLMKAPRSASVRSLGESTLLVLTGDKFQAMIDRAPELRWKLRESATIGEYRNEEAATGTIPPWSKLRHDLLTPVNHILGYAEILVEEIDDTGGSATRERAARIHNAGKAIKDIIDALMPSGRTPEANVMSALSAKLAGPLEAARREARMLEQTVGMPIQQAADAGRVVLAISRLCALLESAGEHHLSPRLQSTPHFAEVRDGGDAGHILVVEDNDTGRDLLARKLERDGYRVSSAGSGESALEMAGTGLFDLVLLDVMMPGIDGIEVLRRWNTEGLLERLPVIVTSAMDEVQSAVRCIELGADDYLTKPFDSVLLRARIRASIERKRWRDAERMRLATPAANPSEKGQAVGL